MSSSPKLSLVKLGLYPRHKTLKIMVLGQAGVGKSALVVRFITRRYIGEYDPTLEKVYSFHTVVDKEMVYFEILDTAGHTDHTGDSLALEANIRWAEAFILMYSVTDKCSFDECYRLKFLINYNKRRRRLGSSSKDNSSDVPVVLVGNKIDQIDDRMITSEEGQRRSKEIGCVCFHEISVRESIDQVTSVFTDACRFWRVHNKNPSKLKRCSSDREKTSPDTIGLLCSATVSPGSLIPSTCRPSSFLTRRSTDMEEDEQGDSGKGSTASSPSDAPFRERASTDGQIIQKPWRWRFPPPGSNQQYSRADRRMSISMRGTNNY